MKADGNLLRVELTKDLDHVRSVMQWPGMWKACSAGFDVTVDQMLAHQNMLYFTVTHGGRDLGLIIVCQPIPLVGEIHFAMREFGARAIEAIKLVMTNLAAVGARLFVALIPKKHRPLLRVADKLGAKDAPDLPSLYPPQFAEKFVFKQLIIQ